MATAEQDGLRAARTELARSIAFHVGTEERLATAVPRLSLHRRTGPTAPCAVTYQPSVIVIAQGQKRVDLGRHTFLYDESRYLLTSVDLPIVSRVVQASEEKPCLAIMLRLDISIVRELLSREDVQATEPAPSGRSAMGTSVVTAELLNACGRLVNLLDTPQDIPFVGSLLEREIVYRVLRGPEGARLRAIATQGDQSQRTAKAIAWIAANFAKPVRVEDLARIAGMGVSTLHHHFRAMTSMSPLQYQKQLRLQTARNRMLVDDLDAASAAFEVGYESASQFNREYSRFFGQPPMRDVRTARFSSAAA